MRILHVITSLSMGGAERSLFNLLAGLGANADHEVVSLLDDGAYGDKVRELGIPVQALGLRRGLPGPSAVARIRALVRRSNPDLIQGWMYHGNLASYLAGRLAPGVPEVVWNVRHSLYGLKKERPMTRHVIRVNRLLSQRVTAIVYNSHLSRQQHEAFGFAGTHGKVIPNGINVNQFRPVPDRAARTREELGIAVGTPLIAHVARFHPMKNHAGFLRAAVYVVERMPDVHMLLVGRDVTFDNSVLSSLVPDSLRSRFHLMGERVDVQDLMQVATVFCQSSLWGEAFPNVLGEAMACQVPCVATDVGDSAAIVGDTGIVVTPGNSNALADALVEMLAKSDAERLTLGQAARRRVEDYYALPKIVEQYAEFYRDLMTASRGAEGQIL